MHNDNWKELNLGDRVKKLRRDMNLSQAALAKSLGLSQWTVSRIEKGTTQKGKSYDCIAEFVAQHERSRPEIDAIAKALATSSELRNLLKRVLLEAGRHT